MPKTVAADPESIEIVAEIQPTPSKKRQVTANIVAGVVTVTLGLAASGVIEKIADRVKNAIAPKPEKDETE